VRRAIAIGLCLLAAGCETPMSWHDATNRNRGPEQMQTDMESCARSTGGAASAVTSSTTAAWDACMRGFGWVHN
jgi:hypothetical protein